MRPGAAPTRTRVERPLGGRLSGPRDCRLARYDRDDVSPKSAIRRLELEGCLNVRDVGGYPTCYGTSTLHRRLLRGDCPHRIGPAGWTTLSEDGVRTVIDLRSDAERDEVPVVIEGADIIQRHLPMFESGDEFNGSAFRESSAIYLYWLRERSDRVAGIMRGIASAPSPSILVHCWSGKDRTGVVIGLLLRLAGVDVDVVASDFALSADLLAPRHAGWSREAADRGIGIDAINRMISAQPGTMHTVLSEVDAEHGGVEHYLSAIGLDTVEIASLRGLLLDADWQPAA